MSKAPLAGMLWAIAGTCAAATVYPYLVYPAILRALPSRPLSSARSEGSFAANSMGGSEFALLFCAYNEAKAMPEKIENLRALRAAYPELEILVYDDGSSDSTADLLLGANLDISLIRGAGRAGKAHGMKKLVSLTERDFLVFTDANVQVDIDAINRLYDAFTDPAVGGVCGRLLYTGADGTAAATAGGLYWRLEEMIKSLESRSGNVMGADGSIFAIRRSLYPDFPDTVLDDMTVSMEVVFRGFRLIKDPAVVAHERLVASATDDYRRRLRIATRVFHTHLVSIRPRLRTLAVADQWRWWSHRYIKWHGIFFIGCGYLSFLMALGISMGRKTVSGALLASAFVGAAMKVVRRGPVSSVAHILSSIFLSGVGVVRARQGHTVTTWKPPTTR